MRDALTSILLRPETRGCAGAVLLAMALSIPAAGATGGTVDAPVVKAEVPAAKAGAAVGKPDNTAARLDNAAARDEAAAVQEPPAAKRPSVAKLADGRDGFIITEVPTMDEASRGDFDRAVAMLKDRDYARAIELLEKVIERSPGATAPYIDIAIAYQRTGRPKLAEERLQTALTLFPGHPVACNECGLLYRKTGRFAEARAFYEKAIEGFPDYYPAHKNLGILCDLYLNDPASALAHYEIYGKARPDDAQVLLWIADVRARLKAR